MSQTSNPASVHPPVGPYSHVSVTPIGPNAKLVVVAGQIGMHAETKEIPESFAEQVQLTYENVRKVLESVGATTNDIVKGQQFVVNVDGNVTSPVRGQLYTKFMGDHRPPSTLLGVAALASPKILFEMEAWAIVTS